MRGAIIMVVAGFAAFCITNEPARAQIADLVPRWGNEQPSFDCATAKTAAARLICADADLARSDRELGTAFQNRKLQFSPLEQPKFAVDELSWIRDRNVRCNLVERNSTIEGLASSKPCLLKAIRERIALLTQPAQSMSNGQQSSTPSTYNANQIAALPDVERVPEKNAESPGPDLKSNRIRPEVLFGSAIVALGLISFISFLTSGKIRVSYWIIGLLAASAVLWLSNVSETDADDPHSMELAKRAVAATSITPSARFEIKEAKSASYRFTIIYPERYPEIYQPDAAFPYTAMHVDGTKLIRTLLKVLSADGENPHEKKISVSVFGQTTVPGEIGESGHKFESYERTVFFGYYDPEADGIAFQICGQERGSFLNPDGCK
jgi:uncharacterized protein YecT (DUF1311 family)